MTQDIPGTPVPVQPVTPRRGKIWLVIGICAGVLALLFGVFALLYWGLRIPLFDRSGWAQTDAGGVCYLDYYGKPLRGWQMISGGRYYFSPADGEAHTGWLELGEDRYFLKEDGRAFTGWLQEADGMRYLDEDGAMHTGWLELPDGKYYFRQDGRMTTGWLEDGGNTYWFAENGRMHTGWLDVEDARYYLDPDGVLCTGWLEQPEGRFYLEQDGKARTGWVQIDGKRYCFDENGAQKTGWLTTDSGRYYLLSDGDLATGFAEIDGVKRYFTQDGAYIVLANPWNPVPEDFVLNLVEENGHQVDASCLEPLREMVAACRAAGYDCKINYAYRDMELQQQLWDNRYSSYIQAGYTPERAWELTAQIVAVPGTSEHHLGLAVDLGTSEGGYRWLEEHGWEFGFIMRYPDGKTDVTGIIYEMWHYRYVGKNVAEAIYSSGLCMEEYLDLLEAEFLEGDPE